MSLVEGRLGAEQSLFGAVAIPNRLSDDFQRLEAERWLKIRNSMLRAAVAQYLFSFQMRSSEIPIILLSIFLKRCLNSERAAQSYPLDAPNCSAK